MEKFKRCLRRNSQKYASKPHTEIRFEICTNVIPVKQPCLTMLTQSAAPPLPGKTKRHLCFHAQQNEGTEKNVREKNTASCQHPPGTQSAKHDGTHKSTSGSTHHVTLPRSRCGGTGVVSCGGADVPMCVALVSCSVAVL